MHVALARVRIGQICTERLFRSRFGLEEGCGLAQDASGHCLLSKKLNRSPSPVSSWMAKNAHTDAGKACGRTLAA